MKQDKVNNIIGTITITLLISLVVILAGVVVKLNRIELKINSGSIANQGPTLQAYVADVSLKNAPTLGNKNAPIVIVEFADYECPFCNAAEKQLKSILSLYEGKILFAFRDFPLEQLHPDAMNAAEAARCAGDQGKYWEMHDLLFSNQQALLIVA